jgi:4-hydroxy-2-oxoheptanedioate aldolase
VRQAAIIFVLAACVMAGRFSTILVPELPGWDQPVSAQATAAQIPEAKRPAPTGTLTPRKVNPARPWGWMVRELMIKPDRKLLNKSKAKMLAGQREYGLTMSGPEAGHLDPEVYCYLAKQENVDHVWFEMQHSTQRFDQVQALMAACPNAGAAPLIRRPDAIEGNFQKTFDMGALGVVIPTVEDAIMARAAARYTRVPPYGYRSCCGSTLNRFWGKFVPQGETAPIMMVDEVLVIPMIETVVGVTNAMEIASVPGIDVVILGNGDLQRFSGHNAQQRFQDLDACADAAYLAGKFWGTPGPVGVGNRRPLLLQPEPPVAGRTTGVRHTRPRPGQDWPDGSDRHRDRQMI